MKETRPSGILEHLPAWHLKLLVLVVLAVLYSLTYSGTFLTDDEHILASRTISLAFDGQADDRRVYGNTRVYALSQLPGELASQANNIEPLQGMAGAPLAVLANALDLGVVQAIFLLNIWVTALCGLVVFSIVLQAGHSKAVALTAALLFGTATQVWAYSRTYFRDPLAMLCLAVAWYCLQLITRSVGFQLKRTLPAWLGLVLSLAAGILAKNTITLALPIILVELILKAARSGNRSPSSGKRRPGIAKVLMVVIVSAAMLLIAWLFLLPRWGALARFTPAYYLSVAVHFFTTPHPHLLQALAGPFISPGKSIFLYSPILVIAVLALIRFPKRNWSAWAYLLLLVIGQALFYDSDWWGHRSWGLRFILPALPLLMAGSAPLLEGWLRAAGSRLSLAVLSLFSISIQLIGVLPLMLNYYVDVANAVPAVSDQATVWTPRYSPLLWHLNWILHGMPADLAVVRNGLIAPALGIAFVIFLLLSLSLLRSKASWLASLALLFTLGSNLFMLRGYDRDPAYQQRQDLDSAWQMLSTGFSPGDLVVVKSYATPAWDHFMNRGKPGIPWTCLPYYFPSPDKILAARETGDPALALDEISLSLLQSIPGSHPRVWLVLPSDSPGADLDLEAGWLEMISTSRREWSFPGDGSRTRLVFFDLTSN